MYVLNRAVWTVVFDLSGLIGFRGGEERQIPGQCLC